MLRHHLSLLIASTFGFSTGMSGFPGATISLTNASERNLASRQLIIVVPCFICINELAKKLGFGAFVCTKGLSRGGNEPLPNILIKSIFQFPIHHPGENIHLKLKLAPQTPSMY